MNANVQEIILLLLLLLSLYISGNETKDASKAHLSTVARKPEDTCKQGCLLCEPETLGVNPYSSMISVLGFLRAYTGPTA